MKKYILIVTFLTTMLFILSCNYSNTEEIYNKLSKTNLEINLLIKEMNNSYNNIKLIEGYLNNKDTVTTEDSLKYKQQINVYNKQIERYNLLSLEYNKKMNAHYDKISQFCDKKEYPLLDRNFKLL